MIFHTLLQFNQANGFPYSVDTQTQFPDNSIGHIPTNNDQPQASGEDAMKRIILQFHQ